MEMVVKLGGRKGGKWGVDGGRDGGRMGGIVKQPIKLRSHVHFTIAALPSLFTGVFI